MRIRMWLACAVVGGTIAAGVAVGTAAFAIGAWYHVYFNRENLPDLGALVRFEFPAIGHVYDSNGQPLIELAREYRVITPYTGIPPVVRDAILAAEDKHFFSHNGVDYHSIPRVLTKVRVGAWGTRLLNGGRRDNTSGPVIFPQGGSTITQQLVRGIFLRHQASEENSHELRNTGLVSRVLSSLVGARNANMVWRKREEIRLSLSSSLEASPRFSA